MGNDLDLRDVSEVRRRVVLPVAQSLLSADELEDVRVEIDSGPIPGMVGGNVVRLAVKACGEWLEAPRAWSLDDPWCDARWLADQFYDLLQDELAESRLAWGELRQGSYEVPPAPQPQ